MSETIALILAPLQTENNIEVSLEEVKEGMKSVQLSESFEIQEWVVSNWRNMGSRAIQIFNKLVTGSFRSPFNPSIFSNSQFQMQPISLKLVLLYAERGRVDGRTRFTEFTLGIASGESWVTFTKVAVHLPELEFEILERWIIENTQEKYGPVHRLQAMQVFTVNCITITPSKRHKSGYRVTEAKIITWEDGLPLDQVTTIESIGEMLSI
jgi:DNA ligase-1